MSVSTAPSVSIAQRLIPRGESDRLEFQADAQPDVVGPAVCAFLNGEGGMLIVGVSARGRVIGVRGAAAKLDLLRKALATDLHPVAPWSATVERIRDTDCIVLDVPPGTEGPYIFKDRIFVREGSSTLPAAGATISALIDRRRGQHARWERMPALGFDEDDLDGEEILRTARAAEEARFYRFDRKGKGAVGEVLEKLNLSTAGGLLNGAVVLFAEEPQRRYPQTRVHAASFGTAERLSDSRIIEGHLFDVLAGAESFLRANLPLASELPGEGFRRRDRPRYPWLAVREGVVNALAHRDYGRYDGGLNLSIYPDRLTITNTGTLPEGMTGDDLKTGFISRPHNPDIAHVLLLRGLMEQLGTGVQRIVRACAGAGLPEPLWQTHHGAVSLTLALGTPRPSARAAELNPRQAEFLEAAPPGAVFSIQDYRTRFAAGVSDRQARIDLLGLVNAGLVQRLGRGRSTRYLRPLDEEVRE